MLTPTTATAPALDPADRRRAVAELRQFVRFPSVSAQPRHAADVRRCARWLADHLRRIGLDHVRILTTAGHPIVYADWLRAPGRPTVLVYGHYDVQPADPVAAWTAPPFGGEVRGAPLRDTLGISTRGRKQVAAQARDWWRLTHGLPPARMAMWRYTARAIAKHNGKLWYDNPSVMAGMFFHSLTMDHRTGKVEFTGTNLKVTMTAVPK